MSRIGPKDLSCQTPSANTRERSHVVPRHHLHFVSLRSFLSTMLFRSGLTGNEP